MKYIIPLLMLAFSVKAQSISVDAADKETGGRTVLTRNFAGSEVVPDDTVAKSGLVFFSAGFREVKSSKSAASVTDIYFIELNIVHKDARLGCLRQGNSKVVLELEDGSTIECTQISDTDCDPVGFMSAFALMPKDGTAEQMKQNFEKLKVTAIKKIDVFTSEKQIVYAIKSKSKSYLQRHFALLGKTISK